MKVWIHGEETYPDYMIDDPTTEKESVQAYIQSHIYDVPISALERWTRAADAYHKAQDEIKAFVGSKWENGKRVDQ